MPVVNRKRLHHSHTSREALSQVFCYGERFAGGLFYWELCTVPTVAMVHDPRTPPEARSRELSVSMRPQQAIQAAGGLAWLASVLQALAETAKEVRCYERCGTRPPPMNRRRAVQLVLAP